MDKEEILAKSRAENKNKDVYGYEISKLSGSVTTTVMLVIAGVFFVVQAVTGGGLNFGLWALVLSADMANHWFKYIKLRLGGRAPCGAVLYVARIRYVGIPYLQPDSCCVGRWNVWTTSLF